jgi:hypothetical protein
MAHATDIVAYGYNADIYCPRCIIAALPTAEGGAFDGWALAPGVRMSTEDNLDKLADAFGIDREDERSFDSGEFPKVVFRDIVGTDVYCGRCQEPIGE